MSVLEFFRFLFVYPCSLLYPVGTAFVDMPLTDIFIIGFFAVGLISGAFRLVFRLSEE